MLNWVEKNTTKYITIDGFWVHYVEKSDGTHKPLILAARASDSNEKFYIFFSMMCEGSHGTTIHKNNIDAGNYGTMIACDKISIPVTTYKHFING